jgi:uncharacterized 2Fe-2S/4Fe-4S cluster protein (DUF4445 family)
MPELTVVYGETKKTVRVPAGTLLGDAVAKTELPLEQPCAGRGTCGACKVLVESGAEPPDPLEQENLSPGELALGTRLACRARIQQDMHITLAPIVVYSNKTFRASNRYKKDRTVPLGLAIDLGSTTVAAFLTMLDDGEVCAGAASLNQQTVYGADVISRLAAAQDDPEDADRLRKLALASINQAIDGLKLSDRLRQRVERVVIVGNVAMHHLLLGLPIDSLAELPFQPYQRAAVRDVGRQLEGIFAGGIQVDLPPLIGGFVGSDALACLAYFGFDNPTGPMAAIDMGTNGEVLVTDGRRIVTASTAAGPAFEGVNISCGSRAVDGAVVAARVERGGIAFDTIGDEAPVGLTGSGLLSLVHALREVGAIEASGRFAAELPKLAEGVDTDRHGARRLRLSADGRLGLSQWDVRELQKAKGAIRAATEILLAEVNLRPSDLERVILTGSFGGQLDIDAALGLGLIPPVRREAVQTIANGAGLGAALFLTDEGFARGEAVAAVARQLDLDLDPMFNMRYVESMVLAPDNG